MPAVVFIDSEINPENGAVMDIGAVKEDGSRLHSSSVSEFTRFISGCGYICGHNIIAHDLVYLKRYITDADRRGYIDTLCVSPLLFPSKPYHALLKDDKLNTDDLNNPLNDSIKAQSLFYDEVNAFRALDFHLSRVYCALLHDRPEFKGFFYYLKTEGDIEVETAIRYRFKGMICEHADMASLIRETPVELAYTLALISTNDRYSVTPPWVYKNYPLVENVMKALRNTPCDECEYCRNALDVKLKLKSIFGYDEFRTYNGEPLQEKAADAAVHNRSLLAIFPTGGGKSITFQLPALMAGDSAHGLTVVISPLQSLMKDQVDNLNNAGIVDAVTINGLLSPIERSEAFERVSSGLATLLYISPESLRSRSIEHLLLSRNVVRFVIDEAHCFSAWGQDFRVDYMYIGDFIRTLQEKKRMKGSIPVSCFTATAKQKVISDIRDYFMTKLGIELDLYATGAARTNLHYAVLYMESDEEKYNTLRSLIEQKDCPTIVYVSRTKRTDMLAEKLTKDGFAARPFNGKMDSSKKIENQEAFISNKVQVIVATSAFGMGVDKKDVKLVIHYDISDSLENYVQEAGRAGRDQSLQAECFVLFNDGDLDKHFMLLNQTKLSISEIQQVWKAIKDLTRFRPRVCRSALEIARQAGWDDGVKDIETRVKTAISALEEAGYIRRGMNMPHVYATSILARNMAEAVEVINKSDRLNEQQKPEAQRIIKSLISSRSIASAGNDDAESRVDYLSDTLGIPKANVIGAINLMREEGLLADSQDMTAYVRRTETQNKSLVIFKRFIKLERHLLSEYYGEPLEINLKEANEKALAAGIKSSSVSDIKTILYFWTIKGYIQKLLEQTERKTAVRPLMDAEKVDAAFEKRASLCEFIIDVLYKRSLGVQSVQSVQSQKKEEVLVQFSLLELVNEYNNHVSPDGSGEKTVSADAEDALLFLAKTGAINLEGGFMVLYSGMDIIRLERDNKIMYKQADYKQLDEYYKQRIQQIHIVGEYANMMVKSYDSALQFVSDYFQLDYKPFIQKYFKGDRGQEINRNITPAKYNRLFNDLSEKQREIISDDASKYIVVAAGPGSGKTRVLVHKLASLMLLEDVKHEQLLMITFSRAAATEFKLRLMELIGNAAHFVEIKTFHSYCFDLLGKIGTIEDSTDVVRTATEKIRSGEVEIGRITKTVVVIDEAQDMDENEYALVQALMERNDNMRVIAVGDDDQNIYEFRGSDSKYMCSFITDKGAVKYEMSDNYRSGSEIIALANRYAAIISKRMKTAPITAVKEDKGTVRFYKERSSYLEIPVAEDVKATYTDGSACVLTRTNEEALRMVGVLTDYGINAQLIQSNDGFNLYNLAELRYFLKRIDAAIDSPTIPDEVFNAVTERLCDKYARSKCLAQCLKLLKDFKQTRETKYRTDLEEYIRETQLEDLYEEGSGKVFVSTIHKSKGHEFDNVYMLMNGVNPAKDSERRAIYVGMTRAKQYLSIHYSNAYFDRFTADGIEVIQNETVYNAPAKITLQLSHKDVNLSFFKDKRDAVCRLRSGDELICRGRLLYRVGENKAVAMLSKAFSERLDSFIGKGYSVSGASVRYIVAWWDKDNETEYPIVLADVMMKRQGVTQSRV